MHTVLLVRLVSELRAIVKADLLPWVEREAAARKTDDLGPEFAQVIEGIKVRWGRGISEERLEAITEQSGARVDAHNAGQQMDMLAGTVNVDLIQSNAHLARQLPGWTADHVALIKRGGEVAGRMVIPLEAEAIAKIATVTEAGFAEGLRHETIAKNILKAIDTEESRARLIARDQVKNLNAKLTRSRQETAGFDRYEWSTSRDRRVRASHAALEGETFSWAEGHVSEGHPGDAILCRCVALPIR